MSFCGVIIRNKLYKKRIGLKSKNIQCAHHTHVHMYLVEESLRLLAVGLEALGHGLGLRVQTLR